MTKKKRPALQKRHLALEDSPRIMQQSPLSKSWYNFVNIVRILHIALLGYFIIGSFTGISSDKPVSCILWLFISIATLLICYSIYDFMISKNTSPYLPRVKKPIGTKFDRFIDIFAKGISYLSYAIAVWGVFLPKPYAWATWAAMVYPILLILIIKCSGNRLTLDKKDNGDRDLSYPMMASLLPAFARGIMDFSLDHYAYIWYLAIGMSLGLVLLFVKNIQTGDISWNNTDRYISFSSIWIVFLLYAIGIVRIANCYFDTLPQEQTEYVVSKSISKSKKNRSYWVKISPTGNDYQTESKAVDIDTYDKAKAGDAVKIYVYKGTLNAAWHEVSF